MTAITKNTASEPEQQLTKYEEDILLAVDTLTELADSLPAEQKAKVLVLANLTKPTIKGVVGKQRITIPIINIRQKTTENSAVPENCKVGELYSSFGDALGSSIRLIPILVHVKRVKWGVETLDCTSLDGVNGSRYGSCDMCPNNRYEKGVPPECSQGHCVYAVTEDLTSLYRIDFLKTNAKAGRNLLKQARPPALWARSVVITTEFQTNKAAGGTWYTLKTGSTGQCTDAVTMQVCDALHDFFSALHAQALQLHTMYNKTATETAPAVLKESTANISGAIDFSDSM